MSIIGKLLEKIEKYRQELEFQDKSVIMESETEEIQLSKDEYKRVMAVLETWLKSNPALRKQKYLEKGIQSTETHAYAYTFKKVGGTKGYIIIYKESIK